MHIYLSNFIHSYYITLINNNNNYYYYASTSHWRGRVPRQQQQEQHETDETACIFNSSHHEYGVLRRIPILYTLPLPGSYVMLFIEPVPCTYLAYIYIAIYIYTRNIYEIPFTCAASRYVYSTKSPTATLAEFEYKTNML